MMSPSALWSVTIVLLLVSRSALSVPSCGMVTTQLTPCLSYLQGKEPTAACCTGIKQISNLAPAHADRVVVCNCGKTALKTIKYDPKRIPPLPGKCGVNFPLPPIDQNTDCNKMPLKDMLQITN